MEQAATVGFVGLGSMGSAMALRLVEAGHDVLAYDPVEAARAAFTEKGGRAAGSVREMADAASTVFLSLPTPAIVLDVCDTLANGTAVRIVVDMSTTGPSASKSAATLLSESGRVLVDCPVSGGRAKALDGKLALMVAGSDEAVAHARPFLDLFGKAIVVGANAGDAQTMKLINNLLSVVALAASSEALAIGAKAGLKPEIMLEVINVSTGRNSATADKIPRFVLPRTFDFGFATALSVKDIKLCLDEAAALGVPTIVGSSAQTMLNISHAKFGPQSDLTCIARVVEEWAGVEMAGEKPDIGKS